MAKDIRCPQCEQADLVEKVSTIYLVGIGLKQQPANDDVGASPIQFKLANLSEAELRTLARRLKPPAATKRLPSRPLHPDLIVITFSLVFPIFIYGIWTSQPPTLLPVLIFLAAVYGLYFWKRKAIVTRFENRQATERAADGRVRQGIERWMKLYYCARDDGVFIPGSRELTPSDQVMSALLQDK
jgi:hypothetical protein